MSGLLGAVSQRVTLTDYAGVLLAEIPASDTARVEWTRESRSVSVASTAVVATDQVARDVEPWVHRLNVWRGEQLAWTGPVIRTAAVGTKLTVAAADPGVWFERRKIKRGRLFSNTDLSIIAAQIIEDAFEGDDPDRIVDRMIVAPTGVFSSVTITPNTRYVSEQLADLADLGLVWQFVAGVLIVGPAVEQIELASPLVDEHFSEPVTVIKDGAKTATSVTVLGTSSSATVGVDPSEDPGFGRIERIVKADTADSVQACTVAALDELNRSKVTPRSVTVSDAARLSSSAPVQLGDLMPGVRIPIATTSTGIDLGSVMRLQTVRSIAQSGTESIMITVEDAPPPRSETEIAEIAPTSSSPYTIVTSGGPIVCQQVWEPTGGFIGALLGWGKWVEKCTKDGKPVTRSGKEEVDTLPATKRYSYTLYVSVGTRPDFYINWELRKVES